MTLHEKIDLLIANYERAFTYEESTSPTKSYSLDSTKVYMFMHSVSANGFGADIAMFATDGDIHVSKTSKYADGIGYCTVLGIISNASYLNLTGVAAIRQAYNIVCKI